MLPRWMVRIHAPSLTAPSHLKTSLTHSVTKKRAAISVRSASSGRRDKSFGRPILLCLCPRENGNVSQNRIRPQDETINLQPPLASNAKLGRKGSRSTVAGRQTLTRLHRRSPEYSHRS